MSTYDDAKSALQAALVNNRTTFIKPAELQELLLALTDALAATFETDTVTAAQISDASANGRSLITAANYAAMKALLSIGQSDVSGLSAALALLAPLASPGFTGTPTVPTVAGTADSSTKAASTAFVQAVAQAKVDALINGAPGFADTLKELSDLIAADESTAAALATTVAGKLSKASNLSDLASVSTALDNLGFSANAKSLIGMTYTAMKAALAIASTDVSGLGALATQANLTATQHAAVAFGPFTTKASAATCDLSTVNTTSVDITGTTTITSFGTGANLYRIVKFSGVLTLTHNATSLILPTSSNIATAAGDTAGFVSDGSGNWRCIWYQKNDGTPLVTASASIAAQADAETGTDNAKQMTALRTSQEIVNRPTSFKNIAGRNGGMEVWQRGTSVSVAASTTAYTLDGWYLKTGANQAATVAQVTGLVAQSQFAAKAQRNSGQTGTGAMYFAMPLDIDELIKLRSGAAVLSFQVSTGANWSPTSGTLTYNVYCGTGAVGKRNSAAYTSETNPITGTVNLTTSQAATQVISSVSSDIGSGITQAEIQFSWTPTGTAGANDWFAIDDVQLEIVPTGVSAVTPKFERISMSQTLQECARFLTKFRGWWYGILAGDNYGSATTCSFPVEMRTTPSITFTSTTNSARFPSGNLFAGDVSTVAVGLSWYGSAGGNDTWFAQGFASAEI